MQCCKQYSLSIKSNILFSTLLSFVICHLISSNKNHRSWIFLLFIHADYPITFVCLSKYSVKIFYLGHIGNWLGGLWKPHSRDEWNRKADWKAGWLLFIDYLAVTESRTLLLFFLSTFIFFILISTAGLHRFLWLWFGICMPPKIRFLSNWLFSVSNRRTCICISSGFATKKKKKLIRLQNRSIPGGQLNVIWQDS